MSTQKPAQSSLFFDGLKWLVVVALLALTVVGNIHYQAEYSPAIRAAVIIVVAIVMLLITVSTRKGGAVWGFLKAARMEMRKVVWPSRQETTQTTLIVIVLVAVMSLLLWGVDSLFAYIVTLIVF